MRAPSHRYTWRHYLEVEESSQVRHEFYAGEIYAMAGGTPAHAALAVAAASALHVQLRGGPCRAYSSDLRIRILASGLGTYPDVSVVCGELQRDPEDKNTVTNPSVLLEVLSDSTEEYDRSAKFEHFRLIPSLQEYVLVSHRERLLEVFTRTPSGPWRRTEARTGGEARLDSIGATLRVDELYDGVDFG